MDSGFYVVPVDFLNFMFALFPTIAAAAAARLLVCLLGDSQSSEIAHDTRLLGTGLRVFGTPRFTGGGILAHFTPSVNRNLIPPTGISLFPFLGRARCFVFSAPTKSPSFLPAQLKLTLTIEGAMYMLGPAIFPSHYTCCGQRSSL